MFSSNSYICNDAKCQGLVRPLLAEDNPGEHVYVFSCRTCHHEYGPTWVERHHGASELPPVGLLMALSSAA